MSQAEVALPEEFAKVFFEELKGRIRNESFRTWFGRARVRSVTRDALELAVESLFMRDWIQRRYLQVLEVCAQAVDGLARRIQFAIEAPATEAAAPPVAPPGAAGLLTPALDTLPRAGRYAGTTLNRTLIFQNFVVGPSNNLPYAAARAVAERPGHAYNPLFIHGSVGLGKTHLLQAICHEILARPDADGQPLKISYNTCEGFINQFITAIQRNDLENFRGRFRNCDILVVDDIHLLAHKERSQEEFFHTFNHLVNAGRQVVFSSDSPPQDIPSLEDRLVSRFKMGLVGELEPPDLETRIAIVKHKARIRGAEFSDDVAVLIAEQVKTNIRELEGAVIEVIGYAHLNDGRPIDLALAQQALKPVLGRTGGRLTVTMQSIFDVVQAYYGVTLKDMQSRKRTQTIATARHVSMYLARTYTRHSLQEIGGYLGGKDHSCVIYAGRKVRAMMRSEGKFREAIEDLVAQLLGERG